MYSDLNKSVVRKTTVSSTFDNRFYTFTVAANTVAGFVLFLKDCLVVKDSCFNLGGMHECTPAARRPYNHAVVAGWVVQCL